jgi:hypothetical protein
MIKRTITGIYTTDGQIRFHGTIRVGRKLPLRNRTALRFRVVLPDAASNPVFKTFGALRLPKRLARQIAESPTFSALNA